MGSQRTNRQSRRAYLKRAGAAASIAFVAGCTEGTGGGGNGTDENGGGSTATVTSGSMSLEEAAKEEGEVRVLSSGGLDKFVQEYEKEFGISTTYKDAESEKDAAKVVQQHNANNVQWDVYGTSRITRMVNDFDPRGILRRPKYDALAEATQWHGENETAMEREWQLDLHWLFHRELLPEDRNPKTWDDLIALGEEGMKLTMDTSEHEYVVVWEDLFDEATAEKRIKEWRAMAEFKESHSGALREVLAGQYFGGTHKYRHLYTKGEKARNVLYPASEEFTKNVSPIIVYPQFFGLLKGGPNPAAAEHFSKYFIENHPDFKKDILGPYQYRNPFLTPADASQYDLGGNLGDPFYKIGPGQAQAIEDAFEKWAEWTGVQE